MINKHGFVVPFFRELELVFKTLSLIDGIVELAEGVGVLAAHDEQLEAIHEGRVGVLPVIGATRLALDQLRRWQAGDTIDLTTRSSAPVDLLVDARWVASGEPVRIDGELGVRVTERESTTRGEG